MSCASCREDKKKPLLWLAYLRLVVGKKKADSLRLHVTMGTCSCKHTPAPPRLKLYQLFWKELPDGQQDNDIPTRAAKASATVSLSSGRLTTVSKLRYQNVGK